MNQHHAFKSFLISLIACLCLICGQLVAYGQTDEEQKKAAEIAQSEMLKEKLNDIESLRNLFILADELRKKIKEKENKYLAAKTAENKSAIADEVSKLNNQLQALEDDFVEISTGIDLSLFQEQLEKKFDWQSELMELIKPAVNELKEMTARPRQIEKLRSSIIYYEKRIPAAQNAIEKIEIILPHVKDKNLKNKLAAIKEKWQQKVTELNSQLKVAQLQLEKLTADDETLLETTQSILQLFFKSRVRNLLMSLGAFLTVLLTLRLLHKLIAKYNPSHRAATKSFQVRLFDIVYHITTVVVATASLLAVLYTTGDWVLLSFAILFLLGLGWTAKAGLPRYWEQIKLLLNLGTVREHERIIFEGIPWEVESLGLFTTLNNPELKATRLRIPIQELIGRYSRPYEDSEPWFPCREGDWVILADGTRGKVISQTHEMVRLVLRGGARKTYMIQDFLGQSPLNLSSNFRLKISFGIDYAHQFQSTNEIPAKLSDFVKQRLEEEGYEKDLLNLRVEFENAAASSLDLVVIADFAGKVAAVYNRLKRLIAAICVEASNQHNWEIPFTQITIHDAGGGMAGSSDA
jgi:small-conductance mechanosensitive channel